MNSVTPPLLLVLGAIVALYVIAAEGVEHAFYQRVKF
jgi:hypothetical protein